MERAVTRSRTASSESRAAVPTGGTAKLPSATERLIHTLQELNDDATIHGKDAKTMWDAIALAIKELWKDARTATTTLAGKIDEGNSNLLHNLNDSFAAVGERIDSIPLAATCNPDGSIPGITPFSGEDATQFSVWLRRLEDIMRMQNATSTSQRKATLVICYLDGVAREKIEELIEQDRTDYNAIVPHLRKFFEGPQYRYMVRQSLSSCQQ